MARSGNIFSVVISLPLPGLRVTVQDSPSAWHRFGLLPAAAAGHVRPQNLPGHLLGEHRGEETIKFFSGCFAWEEARDARSARRAPCPRTMLEF